jgi:hypothetical protein
MHLAGERYESETEGVRGIGDRGYCAVHNESNLIYIVQFTTQLSLLAC